MYIYLVKIGLDSPINCDRGHMRESQLAGQTVVVIGGSAGIGYETARLARAEGAEVVLTGRNPERLDVSGGPPPNWAR
jgi:NADPH:quinone reductase-like Zn-dependent oxidoreductase